VLPHNYKQELTTLKHLIQVEKFQILEDLIPDSIPTLNSLIKNLLYSFWLPHIGAAPYSPNCLIFL